MTETDPTLIIISGLPGTGKSTLARRIGAHFALPVIYKDELKETLCDVLGCPDLTESRRLGNAAIALIYQFAETILSSHQPCVIESYFHSELSTQDLLNIQQRSPFLPLQIHCHTDPALSFKRYKERFESGVRHPGHLDLLHIQSTDHTAPLFPTQSQALAVGGHLIELDMTDFATIDYEALFSQIGMFLGRRSEDKLSISQSRYPSDNSAQ